MTDKTETLEIDNAELSSTEDTIKSNTQVNVAETLDLDKQKILDKIRKAQSAEKRVKLFAKLTDKY
jgi:hypothetical protein